MNKFSTIVTGIVGIFCLICGIIMLLDPGYLKDGIVIFVLGIVFLVYAVKRWKKLAAMPKREKKSPYDFEANKPQKLTVKDKEK